MVVQMENKRNHKECNKINNQTLEKKYLDRRKEIILKRGHIMSTYGYLMNKELTKSQHVGLSLLFTYCQMQTNRTSTTIFLILFINS